MDNEEQCCIKGPKKTNDWLVKFMKSVLEDGKEEVEKLQRRLDQTYKIIVFLSVTTFLVGICLIAFPVIKGIKKDDIDWLQSLAVGGLGLADLTGLYLFQPVEQIRKIMADMSQLTVAINSHQAQVSLRLLETDSRKRATMGAGADYIGKTARDSLRNIQKYFEEEKRGETERNVHKLSRPRSLRALPEASLESGRDLDVDAIRVSSEPQTNSSTQTLVER